MALWRRANLRDTDVRLDEGVPFKAKAWPRATIDSERWLWKTVLKYRFNREQHINELELNVLVQAVKWRLRISQAVGSRFVSLCDSQVVIGVATKCRSTSYKLNRILSRLNALCIASFLNPVLIFVRSASNPADAPSRM